MAYTDLTLQRAPAERVSLFEYPATRISWKWWGGWVLVFGAFSMIVPRDASYDIVHYHLHNGWAALNGRDGYDLAPAELHSFLNPVWQVFVWLLIDNLPGRAVALILGMLQALSLPAIYALTRRLLVRANSKPALVSVLAIALAGFTAESQFGLFGSIRNDAVLAGAVVAAFALILTDDRKLAKPLSFALASFIVGATMGIKLTSAMYVLMFAITAIVLMPDWKTRAQFGLICAGAGLAGVAIFGGPWALYLWDTYGNPMFPVMNSHFDAPLGPDTAFRDERMLPDSLLAAILKPFAMLVDASNSTGAFLHFFDPRMQMSYVCSFVLLVTVSIRHQAMSMEQARIAIGLGAGISIGILAWVLMFSFSRYIAAVWLMGPALLAFTVALWRPQLFEQNRTPLVLLLLASILYFATTTLPLRRANWTSWTERYVEAQVPASIDYSRAIVAVSGEYPGAFLAPYFPEETQFTHLVPQDWSAPALHNYRPLIRDLIQSGTKDLYVVIVDVDDHFERTLMRLQSKERIRVDTSACDHIKTSFENPEAVWKICPAYSG